MLADGWLCIAQHAQEKTKTSLEVTGAQALRFCKHITQLSESQQRQQGEAETSIHIYAAGGPPNVGGKRAKARAGTNNHGRRSISKKVSLWCGKNRVLALPLKALPKRLDR